MSKELQHVGTKESIENCRMLQRSDVDYIVNALPEVQENWAKRQVFRTETEMYISVLNDTKHPTPASKYWQCVREQAVFYENLVMLSFDYRRNLIEQKKLERKIAEEQDELELELLQIDLEQKQFNQTGMEQVAKDRVREIRLWSRIMSELVQEADFDTEDVNTHQLLSYAKRFQKQAENIPVAQSSISEINNLMGQFQTTVRYIEEIKKKKQSELEKKSQTSLPHKQDSIIRMPLDNFPSLSISMKQT